MSPIIANLRSIQGMGIFADRSARSPDLALRRYNLIYGFNGSGKSTLSRLFASLESGSLHPQLPESCSFEIALSDGAAFGCPSRPNGLERRLLVFNADYIEQNLQWSAGRASPVFFIGADQAEAASKLTEIEGKIADQTRRRDTAETAEKAADKAFSGFKRERAKLTASRLHLGNRKYEAPALTKDYETWKEDAPLLGDGELEAAEEIRRRDEPLPRLNRIEFDAASIATAFQFITEICGQSMAMVALDEVQRFPDMLLWLKQGHEFHDANALEDCLFCGSPLLSERRALLASAFDSHVDQFVARLAKTAERLQSVMGTLAQLAETVPIPDALVTELRVEFEQYRS